MLNLSASFEIVRILSAQDSRSGEFRVLRCLVRSRYDQHDTITPCTVLARKDIGDQLPVGATNLMVSGTVSPSRQKDAAPRLTLIVDSVATRKRA